MPISNVVSEATRFRLGPTPKASQRPRVAAILPMFTTAFYFEVCSALFRTLAKRGVDLVLIDAASDVDADLHLDRLLAERSCQGIVLCSMDLSSTRKRSIEMLGLPVVALDYPAGGIPSIGVDNVAGGRLLSETLSAGGSQRQVLLTGTRLSHAFRDREAGFLSVAPQGSRVFECDATTIQDPAPLLLRLLAESPSLDGIACGCDTLALAVLKVLREWNCRVPEDVQVLGHDDMPMAAIVGLSTIRQPIDQFGTWAAEAILDLIEWPHARAPQSVILPVEVVHRGTTKRVRMPDEIVA
jgi:DNA-binding LacI/PurR family transcriptional regulator